MGLINDIPESPTRAIPIVTYEGENVPTSARGYPLGSAHLLALRKASLPELSWEVRAAPTGKKEPRGLGEVNLSILVPG